MTTAVTMALLTGKVALVTGAAGGIGRAAALEMARAGAKVCVVDINEEQGEITAQLVREAGGEAFFQPCNVTLAEDCQRVLSGVIERWGKLDVLFNNAGITRRRNVIETTEQEWDQVMAVNVKSIFLMCKYAVPLMADNGGGSIINTASGWGLVGGGNAVSYCASKGAVVLLTKAMAVDHGPQNIRVNCVCPGDTDTNMLRDEALQLGQPEMALVEAGVDRPLQRVGQPSEIGQVVVFLASDMSSFVTGDSLVVDGGGLAGSA